MAKFFDLVGEDGWAQIELVRADAAGWIEGGVYDRCRNAGSGWRLSTSSSVGDKRSSARSGTWPRRADYRGLAKITWGPRYALCKNPADLTENQSLAQIAKLDNPIDRAYPAQGRPPLDASG